MKPALVREEKNPVITPAGVKPSCGGYRVRGAFNPGAAEVNGEIILLLRVAEDCIPDEGRVAVPVYDFSGETPKPSVLDLSLDDPEVQLKDTRGVVYRGRDYLSTMSHIRLARSRDGVNFKVDDKPFIAPTGHQDAFGVEDARACKIDGRWYINYTSVSTDSYCTSLAVTDDFKTLEPLGIIFPPENKDIALFPEKIGGRYHALHRPANNGFGRASIWHASSPDLLDWGRHKCLIRPRDNMYEEMKIGGGAPPIKTPKGWLEIYHGKGRGQMYSLYALLLDINDPTRIIARGEEPLLVPEGPCETEGFFPNVVFSNGLVVRDDGEILLYYGACDECVCLARSSVDKILATLE